MDEVRKRLGLVVLGLGAQGQRIFRHLSALSDHISRLGWRLHLVGAIDPDKNATEKCRAQHPSAFDTTEFHDFSETNDISSILTYFAEQAQTQQYHACLFYDASPTTLHWKNLRAVVEFEEKLIQRGSLLKPFFFYFGEKPILSFSEEAIQPYDHAFTKSLSAYPHWCDFIETKNPAFVQLSEYLSTDRFNIQQMTFWRCSCVGLERYLFNRRKGITGGCFMDKSIHDLPLMLAILKNDALSNCTASTTGHMPFMLSANIGEQNIALSLSGDAYDVQTRLPPAEANASVNITQNLDSRTVNTTFVSSWLGLLRSQKTTIRSLAETFSKSRRDCIATKTVKPIELIAGYTSDEVRLLHLAGTDKDGEKFAILANLLTRERSDGWQTRMQPWVSVKTRSGVIDLPISPTDALQDCFQDVLLSLIGTLEHTKLSDAAASLGHATSVAVHKIARRVRDELADNFETSGRALLVDPARRLAVSKLHAPYCFKSG